VPPTGRPPVDRATVLALGLVAASFLTFQLAFLAPLDRAISWDEAVYVSQMSPERPALDFEASRARGITLLVAPPVALGASLGVVRVYMAVASAVGLVAAFWPWLAVARSATPVAALIFASSWLALLYASEVMPNLWSALLALAASGLLARSMVDRRRGRRDLVAAAGVLALLGLFRPPDGVPILVAYAVASIGATGVARRVAVPATGVVLGWLPWLVEMSVRFGGPAGAFARASDKAHVSAAGVGGRLLQHLDLTNGPTLGPVHDPSIVWGGLLWWTGTLVAVAIGLRSASGTDAARPAILAAVAGVLLAIEYLVLVAGTAPRFLLPAYALLSVPAAIGVRHAVRSLSSRGARVAVVVALAVPWLLWHGATAVRVEAETDVGRQSLQSVGASLRTLAGGRPCAFTSTGGHPQIEYASGCVGTGLIGAGDQALAWLRSLAARGYRTYVVVRTPAEPPAELGSGVPTRALSAPQGRRWLVYDAAPSEEPIG
jgi:hypothetical protein